MGRLKKLPTPEERTELLKALTEVVESDPVTFHNLQGMTPDEKERLLDMLLADIDAGRL